MLIDFNKLKKEKVERFKGGDGYVINQMFEDENNKIVLFFLHIAAAEFIHIKKALKSSIC